MQILTEMALFVWYWSITFFNPYILNFVIIHMHCILGVPNTWRFRTFEGSM